jgi:di/tricarboxylate transporter
MAAEAAQFSRRHIRTPETKEFFKTSEFFVWAAVTIAILIAGATISGGNDDEFKASTVWTLVTVLSVGYMLSRGLAKTGARRGREDGEGRY